MLRKFTVLVALSLALAGGAPAAHRGASAPVTIMTQNMDDGTDQTYVIAALTGQIPGLSVEAAVDLTYLELQASNFEKRARFLAREIADRAPEIIALQEAVLWRVGPTPETATVVLYDQLDLLLSALRKNNVPYDVIATISVFDLPLAGDKLGALRFTDRNAILVRSDLHRPKFYVDHFQAATFASEFDYFPGLSIPAGWISVDVHSGTKVFRLFTTHLQSPIATIEYAAQVQVKQADELIALANAAGMPVVICGDFNSDANHGGFVDTTDTVDHIEAAGYVEVWPLTHRPRDLGLTWPLFLEDQFPGGGLPPPFFASSEPFERIDLFFSKGLDVVGSDQVVTPVPGSFKAPPFASDHAGVIAVFHP